MNKTQLKAIAGIINQTNSNDKTRNMFTIENGNGIFTPDGIVAYEMPMSVLYQAEETYGITIPDTSGSRTVSKVFDKINYKNFINTNLNAKEFLAELKDNYKEIKKLYRQAKGNDLSPKNHTYKIRFNGAIHGYKTSLLIDVLTVLGNKAEIYIDDNKYGNMCIVSDIGRAIICYVMIHGYSKNIEVNKTIED